MPTAPPCFRPRAAPSQAERKRQHDRRRRNSQPWRHWYGWAVWQRRRRDQLTNEPFCRLHMQRGELVLATVVDHVEPHRGDWDEFIGGELQSLCKTCHDRDVQREERAAGGGSKV